jgi:hypothetical protein
MPTNGAVSVTGIEPRTRTALLLEAIALRHQIAVLERRRTRRPCFRLFDRLFWILLSRWWPDWRDMALSMTISLRMQAVRADFEGFPRVHSRQPQGGENCKRQQYSDGNRDSVAEQDGFELSGDFENGQQVIRKRQRVQRWLPRCGMRDS